MKPIEALKILDPADPFQAKTTNDFIVARKAGAAALMKMIPEKMIQTKTENFCPICKVKVREQDYYCHFCGHALER